MLYPVSKLETLCPLGSEYPCVSLGFGLDPRVDGMTFVLLAWHVSPLEQRRSWTTQQAQQGCSGEPRGCLCLSVMTLPGQATPSGRRESPRAATSSVQNHQLCSSLALPIPMGLSLFPLLLLSWGRNGSGEPVSPSSLELAIFTSAWALVLSSGPSPPKCAYC